MSGELTPDTPSPRLEVEPESPPPRQRDSILYGVGLALLILACHIPLMVIPFFMVVIFVAGFTQWLAVIPLALSLRRSGRNATAKGLLFTAGIACFLNTACCGLLLGSFN